MNFAQRLDPELRTAFAAMSAPGDLTSDVATKRLAISKAVAASPVPPPAHITVENRSIPGPQGAPEVGIRLYTPHTEAALRPGLLWIHGGGFLYGSPLQDDLLCLRFVEEIGCVIVSVDWRLAPEHPYPAGTEDCYAALSWMVTSAADLSIDPARVAVAGASAGGGVAAAVALLARDRGGPRLAFQMLLYGCFDASMIDTSHHPVQALPTSGSGILFSPKKPGNCTYSGVLKD
jgi:acetyl esterase/lipase